MLYLGDIDAGHIIQRIVKSVDIKVYDKLPKYFTTIDEWPSRTSLSCLYCSRKIHGFPIPIVTQIEKDRYPTYGQFCTFSCAKEYIIRIMDDELNNVDIVRRDELISFLMKLAPEFNIDINDIHHPPKLRHMQCYGGDMDPHDWGEGLY